MPLRRDGTRRHNRRCIPRATSSVSQRKHAASVRRQPGGIASHGPSIERFVLSGTHPTCRTPRTGPFFVADSLCEPTCGSLGSRLDAQQGLISDRPARKACRGIVASSTARRDGRFLYRACDLPWDLLVRRSSSWNCLLVMVDCRYNGFQNLMLHPQPGKINT
jgi:hypothetical protein